MSFQIVASTAFISRKHRRAVLRKRYGPVAEACQICSIQQYKTAAVNYNDSGLFNVHNQTNWLLPRHLFWALPLLVPFEAHGPAYRLRVCSYNSLPINYFSSLSCPFRSFSSILSIHSFEQAWTNRGSPFIIEIFFRSSQSIGLSNSLPLETAGASFPHPSHLQNIIVSD